MNLNSKTLTDFLDMMRTPGSEISVYYKHKEIYRRSFGYSDAEKTKRTGAGDLYILYSASKVMTCTAGMQLIERGIIAPDDPVSKYLPEYADIKYLDNGVIKPCEKVMTLRHLFSMCGGLDYDLNAPGILEAKEKSGNKASTREIVASFVKKPLHFEPGTHYMYSLCHDVLAAVIEVASGMSFGDYMRANIWGPLGMKDTCFHPTEEQQARLVSQYRFENGEFVPVPKTCAYKLSDNYESGGAGIISSVDDYILFADAMANGGVGANGAKILKPETIELMRTPQLSPVCFNDFHNNLGNKEGYSYAFGVRTLVDRKAANTRSPIGEFGWDGAAGSYTFIDPENGLSIFYAHQVLGHSSVYSLIQPMVRDAAYGILEELREN